MEVGQAQGGKGDGCPVAGDAALAKASLADPVIQAHSGDYFTWMRRNDPVHYDEKLGMWLISRYDDVVEVLRDPITYSDKMGYEAMYASGHFEEFKQILEREGGGFFSDAIKDDPPAHTRVRRLMEKAFTAHRVASVEPGITKIIVDLVNELTEKAANGHAVEGMHDFAIPLTIRVICEQLGIEQFNAEKISRWSMAVTAQISHMQDREAMLENAAQICELQNFIISEMKKREAEPREDMISDIVHATLEDGTKLEFGEAVSLIRALIIAGNDTTATAIGNLLFVLATQPDVLKALQDSADDDRMLNRFVEELLRVEPPVRGLAKMAIKEVELNGTKLPKGAHMLILYSSANDDDTVFECPRKFDMSRTNLGKQMAFGVGVHRCIGAALARMEIKVAARELVKRVDNLKLAAKPEDLRYLPTVATRTFQELPLTLTRRA